MQKSESIQCASTVSCGSRVESPHCAATVKLRHGGDESGLQLIVNPEQEAVAYDA